MWLTVKGENTERGRSLRDSQTLVIKPGAAVKTSVGGTLHENTTSNRNIRTGNVKVGTRNGVDIVRHPAEEAEAM